MLRIVRGDPTDDEVAALVIALVTVRREAAASTPPATTAIGGWADPAARLRRPLQPGPDAWARSAWPR